MTTLHTLLQREHALPTRSSLAQSIVHEMTPAQVDAYGYMIEDLDDAHHAVFISKMTQHRNTAAAKKRAMKLRYLTA